MDGGGNDDVSCSSEDFGPPTLTSSSLLPQGRSLARIRVGFQHVWGHRSQCFKEETAVYHHKERCVLSSCWGCYLERWQLSVPSESVSATEHYLAMNTTLPGESTSSDWSQRGNCGSPNQGGTQWDNSWQATLAPEFPIQGGQGIIGPAFSSNSYSPSLPQLSILYKHPIKILSQHLLIDLGHINIRHILY